MRTGLHSAQFTVVRGGRTLNVGVVRHNFNLKNEEQQLKNATDDETGWGFDTESGARALSQHPASSSLLLLRRACAYTRTTDY